LNEIAGAPNTFRSSPPHSGQTVNPSSLIAWTMSNVWPQLRHVYS
jgi:hypothetical protein